MDVLDVGLIIVCLGFGFSGYRQGFVVGLLSFAGFIGGGALGAKYANALHSALDVGVDPALFGLLVVVVGAVLGQLLATVVAATLRREMRWQPIRTLDSLAGGAISVISVLLVAWLVGTALAHSSPKGIARQVRHSSVLRGVNTLMPTSAQTWFSSFRRLLNQDGFPEVFGGIGPDHVTPVGPPNPKVAHSRAVRVGQPAVVKVKGVANSCSRQLEGSGFVYAANRVMTNAHVVAGVRSPVVFTSDQQEYHARVVLYDPERDVAVLDVPGLNAAPLSFDGSLSHGQDAVILGYPEDGPFTAVPARVRSVENARGPDIYQSRQVTRQIYSLYASIHPGNSGGPLLTRDGAVAGVVFAAAVDSPKTGYALTASEVSSDANKGETATATVSTQGCD
ncbi:MAG: MarP family serine protease [Frankiaceae bacterium]|nr:MarP family serine protease [Frankiaceae bacterium]MBV9869909.1 MarP family serine protease [Frankiaceae bacterium]